MRQVLLLSYFFPPTGGAPAQRSLKFTRFLSEFGYVPIILTGPGLSHNEWTPIDSSLENELQDGVQVYRVAGTVPKAGGALQRRIGRIFGFPSPFSSWWVQSSSYAAKQAISDNHIQLIYASMSPFESAEVAAHLAAKYSLPWVADLRDPWAIDEIQVYPSLLHRKLALRKMRKLLSSASVIVMNTPEATALLKRTFPEFRSKRVVTITNGFDPNDLTETATPITNKKFTIVHTGSFLTDSGLLLRRRRLLYEGLGGAVPGVDIATRSHLFLFEAIERWCYLDSSVKNNLEIVFAGNSPPSCQPNLRGNSALQYTKFLGYLPRDKSLAVVKGADLLFLAMHNVPKGHRATSAPSKMFEYMASGRTILAAVPDSDAKDYLEQVGTAITCRPDDVDSMVQALARVYDLWKNNRLRPEPNLEFLRLFHRRTLTQSLAREFDGVLSG